jgi:hypothetical protein
VGDVFVVALCWIGRRTRHHSADAGKNAPRANDNHSSDSTSSPSKPHHESWDDDSDGIFSQFEGGLFLAGCAVASTPLWAPSVLLHDSVWAPGYFPHYPYAGDWFGYLQIDRRVGDQKPDVETSFNEPDCLKWWSVRLSVEDGDDFHGLNRLNGQLVFDTTLRLGFWTNWNYLHEQLPCGCTDETLLSDTNLTFRIAQSEQLEMHAGVGLRMMIDRAGDRFGCNFLYGADIFPAKPFIFSELLEGGTLGSAGVFHFRSTAGVIYKGWEVFLGYDFLRVGSVNIQGPMAGLRFWF